MNLVKEKQGGLVPPGLKRWPFKAHKHFADTTRVSPSPAGCCPLLISIRWNKCDLDLLSVCLYLYGYGVGFVQHNTPRIE